MAYLFLAVAALEIQNIHSINIKTTYLYSNLDEEIYIKQFKIFKLSSKKKESLVIPQNIV